MTRTRTLAAGLLMALAGTALHAQPAPPPPAPEPGPGPGMMMQDPFGDATVARKDAEAQAAARFTALDTNADGSLSTDELRAGRPGRGDRAGGRRGGGRAMDGMSRMLDADGDGRITRDEFVTGTLRRFDMADADHDGQLTKAERQAAMEAMRARMEERMRAMMGNGMGGGND